MDDPPRPRRWELAFRRRMAARPLSGMSRGGLCESGGAPTDDGLITSGEARVSHHRARREEGEGRASDTCFFSVSLEGARLWLDRGGRDGTKERTTEHGRGRSVTRTSYGAIRR